MARLLRYCIIAFSFLAVQQITSQQQPSLAQQYSDKATEYWRQHDFKAAFEWYTKAAKMGDDGAQTALGHTPMAKVWLRTTSRHSIGGVRLHKSTTRLLSTTSRHSIPGAQVFRRTITATPIGWSGQRGMATFRQCTNLADCCQNPSCFRCLINEALCIGWTKLQNGDTSKLGDCGIS